MKLCLWLGSKGDFVVSNWSEMKLFALLVPLLLACSLGFACSCGELPPCARVGPNAVIFLGVALNKPYSSFSAALNTRPVRFKIERVYQGLPDETRFVEVDTLAMSSCEAVFVEGVRYVVYAESDSTQVASSWSLTNLFRRLVYGENFYPGRIVTHQCMGSRQVQDAADVMQFLEAFVAHRTVASIQGQVYADPGQGNLLLYDRLRKRMQGSVVTASGTDGSQHSTVADETGRFRIDSVRAGMYKVRVTQAKFRSDFAEYEVKVPERGCGVVQVSMGLDGRVSGRLHERGGNAPISIKVQLIPALDGDEYPSPLETTSATDGTYAFRRVPPGQYVLAVNALDEPTKKVPYKRVYYPGVEDLSSATRIHVGEAEKVSVGGLRLSTRLNPRTISARTVWADGSPARYVHTWCAPTGYTPRQHLLTDGEGQITFPAMDGLAYVIGAAAASNYEVPSKQRISARPVHVPPGPSTSVRLVLSIPPR
jgi:hypothetical protein